MPISDNCLSSTPVRTRDYFDDDNIESSVPNQDDFRNEYSSFKDDDIIGENDHGRPSNFDDVP